MDEEIYNKIIKKKEFSKLPKKDVEKKDSIELADLFCSQAVMRIKRNFKEVNCNNDKLSSSVSKKILKDQFQWLEDNIIT